jgi:hypothetical protein
MGVGQKNIGIQTTFVAVPGAEAVSQFTDAGSGVENYQPVLIRQAQFETERVSAIFHGIWSRAGDRAPYTPEF